MKSKSFLKSPEYANYMEIKSVWEHLNRRKVKNEITDYPENKEMEIFFLLESLWEVEKATLKGNFLP